MAELTFSAIDTTYKTTLGADEVIVGGKDPLKFEPHIEFTKWNECSLTIKAPDIFSSVIPTLDKELTIGDNKTGFYFTPFEDVFKFGLILKEKPKTNSWDFQLEGWEDYEFLHQGVISGTPEWDEITKEWVIPDPNVKGGFRRVIYNGSIVIKHKTKKDSHIYKDGSFGVFHRPRFIDADGKEEYGEINIKDGVYTVSCPQEFLDNAKYPIKANDTFGNTVGTSYVSMTADKGYVTKFQNLNATSGTLASISFYCVKGSGTPNLKGILYDDDGASGAPLTSLDVTSAGVVPAAADYLTLNATIGATITTNLYYYIGGIADTTDCRAYYDAEDGYVILEATGLTYANANEDWSTTYTNSNLRARAYATYTPVSSSHSSSSHSSSSHSSSSHSSSSHSSVSSSRSSSHSSSSHSSSSVSSSHSSSSSSSKSSSSHSSSSSSSRSSYTGGESSSHSSSSSSSVSSSHSSSSSSVSSSHSSSSHSSSSHSSSSHSSSSSSVSSSHSSSSHSSSSHSSSSHSSSSSSVSSSHSSSSHSSSSHSSSSHSSSSSSVSSSHSSSSHSSSSHSSSSHSSSSSSVSSSHSSSSHSSSSHSSSSSSSVSSSHSSSSHSSSSHSSSSHSSSSHSSSSSSSVSSSHSSSSHSSSSHSSTTGYIKTQFLTPGGIVTRYDIEAMRADFPELNTEELDEFKRDTQRLAEDWRQW